jgi:hypothetical protein
MNVYYSVIKNIYDPNMQYKPPIFVDTRRNKGLEIKNE